MPMARERLVRIVLHEPTGSDRSSAGQVSPTYTDHVTRARRSDRGGRQTRLIDTVVDEWDSRFRIRKLGFEGIGPRWELTDDYGRRYRIEGIATVDTTSRMWDLFASAYT